MSRVEAREYLAARVVGDPVEHGMPADLRVLPGVDPLQAEHIDLRAISGSVKPNTRDHLRVVGELPLIENIVFFPHVTKESSVLDKKNKCNLPGQSFELVAPFFQDYLSHRLTIAAISERTGLSSNSVKQVLRRARNNGYLPQATMESTRIARSVAHAGSGEKQTLVIAGVRAGLTVNEIMEKHGFTRLQVHNAVGKARAAGLLPRPTAEETSEAKSRAHIGKSSKDKRGIGDPQALQATKGGSPQRKVEKGFPPENDPKMQLLLTAYNDERRKMISYFRAKGHSYEQSEDFCQRAFFIAGTHLEQFHGEIVNMRPWLWKIARTRASVEVLRSERRRPTQSYDGSPGLINNQSFDPYEAVERSIVFEEYRERLQQALKALPPQQREALLMLADDDEITYKGIAVATKTDEGTVKSRISRGRATLREAFPEYKELLSELETLS